MEFCLLDLSLSVVGYIDCVTYGRVTQRFFAAGGITVRCAGSVALPESARYIYEAESGVCAVIESVSYPKDGTCVISGRTCEWLLTRQLLKRDGVFIGSVENALRTAVVSFATANGAFPNLVLGDLSGLPTEARVPFEWQSLYEWLYITLGRYGASWKLDLYENDSFFTLNVLHGRDLTPYVTLREEDGHLAGASFSFDEADAKNVLCVVGNDGRYVTVPDSVPEGLDRREGVIMARDIYPTSFETEEAYFDALRDRGYDKLSSFGGRVSFTGTLSPDGVYAFGRDFFLGDLCEVVTRGSYTLPLRITEVSESFEKGVSVTEVSFS